jgi:hypothetical protein
MPAMPHVAPRDPVVPDERPRVAAVRGRLVASGIPSTWWSLAICRPESRPTSP